MGDCDTEPCLYLNSLEGIDVVNGAEFTSETLVRPRDMVKKCFEAAQKEVIKDVLSYLQNHQYNQLISDSSYSYAGANEFYGENDDVITLRSNKLSEDKFVRLRVFGFELVSDRDVIGKQFSIIDDYGTEEIINVDIKKGFNKIPVNHCTKSACLNIKFDLSDFKIGVKKTDKSCYCDITFTCNPCNVTNYCKCVCSSLEVLINDKVTSKNLGFNLCLRCEACECALLEYLVPAIDQPLLYLTGIKYLIESELSGRTNPYLRNTEDSRRALLTMWNGGWDTVADRKVPSKYKEKAKQAAMDVENMISKLDSVLFSSRGIIARGSI